MKKIGFAIAGTVMGLIMPAQLALADGDHLPPLAALTAEWWQWAFSIPAGQNPQTDPTGQDCMIGQRGDVWFLAGVFGGGSATRACSVPEGATLFFPLINSVFFNSPDCGQNGQNFTVRELRKLVKPSIDAAQNLSIELDSTNVRKNTLKRIQSNPFAVWFPQSNIYGPDACGPGQPLPAGIYSPTVDDGYYASIPPLERGPHTLQFHAESGSFLQDVTYNLTVVPISTK